MHGDFSGSFRFTLATLMVSLDKKDGLLFGRRRSGIQHYSHEQEVGFFAAFYFARIASRTSTFLALSFPCMFSSRGSQGRHGGSGMGDTIMEVRTEMRPAAA